MASLSVIIATCGRPERLAKCLDAVEVALRTWGGEGEIVVVDNHPEYEAEAVIRDCRPQTPDHGPVEGDGLRSMGTQSNVQGLGSKVSPLVYLRSEPFNKARALNAGIAAAKGEWLAFTDDDTIPDARWLAEACRFASMGACRVFGGRVVPGELPGNAPPWLRPGRSGRFPWLGGALVRYDPLPSSGLLPAQAAVPFGANVLVRRDVLADHGGYDETLWRMCGRAALGVDDGEFGVRLQNAHEPIGYCREATVVHPAHEDRLSIRSHLRTAYLYGWRDPFVFFDPQRRVIELFRIRTILESIARSVRASAAKDYAATVDELMKTAQHAGGLAGRLSGAYRCWAKLHAAGYCVPPPKRTDA